MIDQLLGATLGWTAATALGFLKARTLDDYVGSILRNHVLEKALVTSLQRSARDVYQDWRRAQPERLARLGVGSRARDTRACQQYLSDHVKQILNQPQAGANLQTLQRMLTEGHHDPRREAEETQQVTALYPWLAVEPYTGQCPESLCEAYRDHLLPRQVEWLRELVRQDQRLRDTVFLDLLKSLEAVGCTWPRRSRSNCRSVFWRASRYVWMRWRPGTKARWSRGAGRR